MRDAKTTVPEKRKLIEELLTKNPQVSTEEIQQALAVKFGTRVHNSVISALRREKGIAVKPGGPKPGKKKAKRPYQKKPKLSDEQISMLTRHGASLPPQLIDAAKHLRDMLARFQFTSMTVYTDAKPVCVTKTIEHFVSLQ